MRWSNAGDDAVQKRCRAFNDEFSDMEIMTVFRWQLSQQCDAWWGDDDAQVMSEARLKDNPHDEAVHHEKGDSGSIGNVKVTG